MRLFLFATILTIALIGNIECKNGGKRFLKSWFDTAKNAIMDKVIDPIKGGIDSAIGAVKDNVIDPIADGGKTAIDKIKNLDKLIMDGVLKPIGNLAVDAAGTVVDGFDTAVKTVWKPVQTTLVDNFGKAIGGVTMVIDTAGNIITALSGGGASGDAGDQQAPDFCSYKCRSKNADSDVIFFFDQQNGCVSKGFVNLPYKGFDNCCDAHNTCLNTQCCTNDCQSLKDKCDADYKKCLRGFCARTYGEDYDEMDECNKHANRVASIGSASKCNPSEARNRKLCIC